MAPTSAAPSTPAPCCAASSAPRCATCSSCSRPTTSRPRGWRGAPRTPLPPRRTPDDLLRLGALLEDRDAAEDPVEFGEADVRFHIGVAEAAHNALLVE